MVAFLKKLEGSEGFHQIVDFLNSTHIKYALTENPTIYVSLIHQFWQTASASTFENGEIEITATIDRIGLIFQGEGLTVPIESYHTPTSSPSNSQPLTSPPSMQTTHVVEEKVESLESNLKQTKLTYGAAYTKLIMKARKIAQLDEDEGITLVQMGAQTHGRHEHDLEPDFEFIAPEEVYTAKPDISTANVPVSTAAADLSTAIPKVKTTAESLVYIKRSAAKRKDKGKAIMKEAEPVQKKTKLQLEQERLGYEEALRLKEQLDEEERQRIARVHKEANIFNAEEWDNIQAQIEADEELTQKLQVEERGKFSEVEKARLLVEMINERKRLFAQQRAEQRRNKPMIQAQQRTYMVKDFVPMESDRLVPKISTGSSKRTAKTELDHEGSKRQKTNKEQSSKEEKELLEEELHKLMMIVLVEEVYVEALQIKYPIMDWEVYSEDTRKYWKIIRVRNHTEAYQTFDDMLKKFDKLDLDKIWSLVKERFSLIDPTDDKERTLWVELKRLFEHDIDDIM
ncbi:hypothetical protein Tco_0162321 [Tanacetum coccineum]